MYVLLHSSLNGILESPSISNWKEESRWVYNATASTANYDDASKHFLSTYNAQGIVLGIFYVNLYTLYNYSR